MKNNLHESVMVREAINALHIKNQAKYIDATLGTGGHTEEIVKNGGMVLGIEADSETIKIAEERLKTARPTPKLVQGNFVQIDSIAKANGFDKVSGILFDLGVNNLQLTDSERGFSFSNPLAPIDMRIDSKKQGVTGGDLLNVLRSDQLEAMFSQVLDGGSSRWLTKRVIEKRKESPFKKIGDFLDVVEGIKNKKQGLSSATLPFLALRIAVNSELDNLREVLPKAYGLLEKGGRLVVITFHSGEDKIVKEFFGNGELVIPTEFEKNENKKSRSAKLRILIKNE